ncbi:hypothetical protein PIB30_091982 [Stylosanthes scabra]|uniref:Uncharacterized protein n=1 Tax=Stylosanthes scabra TaxID=79078 RepID=A0ABU6WUN9_9FABA|nr:hypothetical protein [Stylosanthes scabra]
MSLFKDVHQGLSKQVMGGSYSYDQGYTPWNPPPYQLHAPRHNAYQSNGFEGREDAPLNEEDVENLNHEEVHDRLEEVEEENEDQEAEDVDHGVEDKDKGQKGMEIVHSASSKATPSKLPSELQFELEMDSLGIDESRFITCGESEFKVYNGHLHKLHNNRAKVGALNLRKHLGPWKSQEELVDSQRNGWTNQVWGPEKSSKNQQFWGVTSCIGTFRDLLNMN